MSPKCRLKAYGMEVSVYRQLLSWFLRSRMKFSLSCFMFFHDLIFMAKCLIKLFSVYTF